MKRLAICILLVLALRAQAYDPTTDAALEAWWRLGDDTDIVTDSSGNSNTLTNSGVADSGTAWEGSHSGDFELGDGDYMTRSDADLAAGFPLKTGATGDLTVCCAVRFESLPATGTGATSVQHIVAKHQAADGGRSFLLGVQYSDSQPKVYAAFGYDSGDERTEVIHATQVATGRWYHIGVTYVESTKGVVLRIWDDTAGAIHGTDATGTVGGTLYRNSQAFYLGRRYDASYYLDGLLDDVLVFSRALSVDEINAVRMQTFGESAYVRSVLGGSVVK